YGEVGEHATTRTAPESGVAAGADRVDVRPEHHETAGHPTVSSAPRAHNGLSSSGAPPRERWRSWPVRRASRGPERPEPSACESSLQPPIAGADGERERCEDRQHSGEARQDRLHFRLL